jgi:NAD-dependent SIR2 family protein deacetylase
MDITLDQALPTLGHMALVSLKREGVLKFVVSTNIDGLHRRSGLRADEMSELHGNTYKELCSDCGKEFLRKFLVSLHRSDHKTGRKCDDCGGHLIDSIINFGENLPISELEKTYTEAKASDVSFVLGTSMRVQPANLFPAFAVENGGKLVIVNLQKTPYDSQASLIIRAKTDQVLEMLMEDLGYSIQEYDQASDITK